jgi:hypothetical protein
MIGSNNNDDLIPRYRRAGKLLAVNSCFYKAKFRLPIFDGRCNLGRIADARSYLDLRIGAPKRR